jgi:hypothetical protein
MLVHLILVCVPDFSHHLNVCCYFAMMANAAGLNVSCAQYKWLHGVYDPIILQQLNALLSFGIGEMKRCIVKVSFIHHFIPL